MWFCVPFSGCIDCNGNYWLIFLEFSYLNLVCPGSDYMDGLSHCSYVNQ